MKIFQVILIFSLIFCEVTASEVEDDIDGHTSEGGDQVNNDDADELKFCYKYFIDSLKIEKFPPYVHDFTFNIDFHSVTPVNLEKLCEYQKTFYECIGSSDHFMTYANLEHVFNTDRDTAGIYLSKFHELQFICTIKQDFIKAIKCAISVNATSCKSLRSDDMDADTLLENLLRPTNISCNTVLPLNCFLKEMENKCGNKYTDIVCRSKSFDYKYRASCPVLPDCDG